jgi:ferredoxin
VKVIVDPDKCAGHGQCAYAAPEVFRLGPDGDLVYHEDVDDGLREDVEDAIDACPLRAITVTG